jgi:translocator protein
MALVFAGMLLVLVAVACFCFVLLHAFNRSIGTGFMVLLIPIYPVIYGFTQFEHRRKGLILAGWLGGLVLGVVFRVLGWVQLTQA